MSVESEKQFIVLWNITSMKQLGRINPYGTKKATAGRNIDQNLITVQ